LTRTPVPQWNPWIRTGSPYQWTSPPTITPTHPAKLQKPLTDRPANRYFWPTETISRHSSSAEFKNNTQVAVMKCEQPWQIWANKPTYAGCKKKKTACCI